MISRLAICCALLAEPALAQDDPAAAALAASERLQAAAVQLADVSGSRNQVAALTEAVQAYEDGLVALRDGLRRAAIRQQVIEGQLAAKSDEVARLLGVLETMGRAPAPLLLLHPSGALGTARSGMILADVTPALQSQVTELRGQLEEVAMLRRLQDSAAETLRDGLRGVQDARTALSAAISDRTDLPRRFSEDPVQTALLIASTETLDAFASGLATTVVGGAETGDAPDATTRKGTLALPVQGTILRAFNAADAAGVVRPGLVIAARPRALVLAPVASTVRFRGPLLDYGNVIILEPAADVLFVIAGLAETFGDPGQVVPEGSPIGLMGGETPPVDAILTANGVAGAEARSETLYLEVREGQSPVDPATWFATE